MILDDKLTEAYIAFNALQHKGGSEIDAFKEVVRSLLVEKPDKLIQKMDVEVLNATDIKIDGYEYVLKEKPKCKHSGLKMTHTYLNGCTCPECGEKL